MSRKNRFRIRNIPQSIMAGVVIGIISLIISFCVLATIMTNYDISRSNLIYFYFLFSILSGVATGLFTGRVTKSKAVIWASLSAGISAVILLLFLLIFNSFIVNPVIFIIFPLFIISGAAGGIVSANLR